MPIIRRWQQRRIFPNQVELLRKQKAAASRKKRRRRHERSIEVLRSEEPPSTSQIQTECHFQGQLNDRNEIKNITYSDIQNLSFIENHREFPIEVLSDDEINPNVTHVNPQTSTPIRSISHRTEQLQESVEHLQSHNESNKLITQPGIHDSSLQSTPSSSSISISLILPINDTLTNMDKRNPWGCPTDPLEYLFEDKSDQTIPGVALYDWAVPTTCRNRNKKKPRDCPIDPLTYL